MSIFEKIGMVVMSLFVVVQIICALSFIGCSSGKDYAKLSDKHPCGANDCGKKP